MENNHLKNNLDKKAGFLTILKRLWPCFVSHNSLAFTMSGIYINVIIISNLMWPGEPFHSAEIGLLVGITSYVMAISGLLFGYLADRVSRVKLISLSTIFFGIGLFVNGFAPQSLGFVTFEFFIICTLIRGFFNGGFWPIINSYVNDASFEEERSQSFGMLSATFQIIQLIGMVFSAVMFQSYLWRAYLWVVGSIITILGFFLIKGKEPKRAASQKEFQEILSNEKIFYDYRLNKETVKRTVITPTNIIAFAEGVFTTILLSVPDFLLIAYVQSSPHNVSPVSVSLFMIIFGVPGGVLGVMLFAKMSDRLGKKNIKYRVYMIIFSLASIYLIYMFIFSLPLPHLTVEEGNNIAFLLSFAIIWILGVNALIARSLSGLYAINQPPILQKINLPEAQGLISSANQFLELIGNGTGPILAGVLLATFNQNYQITVISTMSLGIIGAFMWFIATFWIDKDIHRISSLLKQRGDELIVKNGNNNSNTTSNNDLSITGKELI